MTPDHSSLEAQLSKLTPSPLDSALLERLEACTDGSITTLTPTELQFEASLRKTRPQALPQDLLADLEGIFSGVPFAQNEKVVLFPKSSAKSGKIARFPRPMWAAAAAVALIGAASALLMPSRQEQAPIAQASASAPSAPVKNNSNIVPAGYNDEGVIWNQNDQPRRVLRVRYDDYILKTDATGKQVKILTPRYEYVLIPEKAD